MSRSGYLDDCDGECLSMGRWRAQVNSAKRGKRGQRFFRELISALDAMPEKRLVGDELESREGDVCALGALGRYNGVDVGKLDTHDYYQLGSVFDIAHQLAQETMYVNDEDAPVRCEVPEERHARVRRWAVRQLVLTDLELGIEAAS